MVQCGVAGKPLLAERHHLAAHSDGGECWQYPVQGTRDWILQHTVGEPCYLYWEGSFAAAAHYTSLWYTSGIFE